MRALGLAAAGALAALQPAPGRASDSGEMIVDQGGTGGGNEDQVRNLPFAQGLSFARLDDYLGHLRRRGATGVPWYREVSRGVYELVARRGPGARTERFTRDELMRRYGFAR